jgi:hypothetical protein
VTDTLPPWESDDPQEQDAFLQWAVAQLDDLAPFTAASLKGPATSDDEIHYWFARHKFEKAKRLLPRITWPAFQRLVERPVENPHETRGRKPGSISPALDDDEKLTWLFQQRYEGRYRRHKKPTREDILRARHTGLTEDDWDKVAAKRNWGKR